VVGDELPIPEDRGPETELARLRRELRELAPWHLDVEVRGGLRTADAADAPINPELGKVSFLDAGRSYRALISSLYPAGLKDRSVLDCACNCGGYCFWSQELGASECFGFDVREHWIRQAEFLARERELPSDGCSFAVLDLYDLASRVSSQFDIAIFKGIFYHLPDPVRGLKIVADQTRELLLLNTMTRAGVADGFLAVAEESTGALMSGVYGLNWLPTGPDVLRRILHWLDFPAVRVSFWQKETGPHSGLEKLGRIELLAARDEKTFEYYDKGARQY
jgi:tRNA (mo5U34)-methyltransferase